MLIYNFIKKSLYLQSFKKEYAYGYKSGRLHNPTER